jgi:RecJ-like exonuclease
MNAQPNPPDVDPSPDRETPVGVDTSGRIVCQECDGTGWLKDGTKCLACDGTSTVTAGVDGG